MAEQCQPRVRVDGGFLSDGGFLAGDGTGKYARCMQRRCELPRGKIPCLRGIVAVIGATVLFVVPASPAAAGLGLFADCLRSRGAVLYDAHWCGNCVRQRKLFRGYANRLKVVPCYAPGETQAMRAACKDAEVRAFPTWTFADGTRRTGALSIDELAGHTGCNPP